MDETARADRCGLRARGLRGPLGGPYDLDVAAGQALAITGPSGAGKSLLLRMIADLDPSEGAASIGGVDRSALSACAWRRRVIYVASDAGWWTPTVGEAFARGQRSEALELAAGLGLPATLFDASPERLSSGERQRFALVRALVRRPDALLLDEPTSALDGESAARVEARLLSHMARGAALVLVTHDMALGMRLAGRCYRLEGGRLDPL